MHGVGMVAGEVEMRMRKEWDMVHGQELDKLGAGVQQDMLSALGMTVRRQHMARVLALEEQNGQRMRQHFYQPSCSSLLRHRSA